MGDRRPGPKHIRPGSLEAGGVVDDVDERVHRRFHVLGVEGVATQQLRGIDDLGLGIHPVQGSHHCRVRWMSKLHTQVSKYLRDVGGNLQPALPSICLRSIENGV